MIRLAEVPCGPDLMRTIPAICLLAALHSAATDAAAAPPAFEQNRAAWRAFREKDFGAAEQAARAAWATAESEREPLQSVFAAANLAAALTMRGRLDEAREWSLRAEERLGGTSQPETRGRLLAARALIEGARGDEAASKQALAEAAKALGAKDWRLRMLTNLLVVYMDLEIAAGYDEVRALRDAARAAGNQQGEAVALAAIGWVEGLGGAESAALAFEKARELFAASGHASLLPLMDHDIGGVFLRAGAAERARAPLERGLEAARKGGDLRAEVLLLDDLSLCYVRTGDARRAREADQAAGERLARLAEDVRSGRLEDSLLLDLRQLTKQRYVNQPSLLVDLFVGLSDQLALEPVAEPGR
jgi:tetratricopeptide (TPR) repeat protein